MTRPLSASQLEKFITCPRQWAFRYISKLPEKEFDRTNLGRRAHDMVEQYYKTGDPPNLLESMEVGGKSVYPGQIAQYALLYLPPRGAVESEHVLEHSIEDVKFVGKIDALHRPSMLTIEDLKTTSDLKWCTEKREKFRRDPQALIYAHYGVVRYNAPEVKLRWVYVRTKGRPAVEVVEDVFTREYTVEAMRPLVQIGRRMLQLRVDAPDPNTLPPRTGACERFGGCSYKERCKLTMQDRLKGVMRMSDHGGIEDFSEFLSSFGASSAPPAPPAPPALVAPPAPVAPAAPPVVVAALDAPPAPAAVAAPPALPNQNFSWPPAAVNPPEAPRPSPAPEQLVPETAASIAATPESLGAPARATLPVRAPATAGMTYESMEAKTLKALAVTRGLIRPDTKINKPALVKLLNNAPEIATYTPAPEAMPAPAVVTYTPAPEAMPAPLPTLTMPTYTPVIPAFPPSFPETPLHTQVTQVITDAGPRTVEYTTTQVPVQTTVIVAPVATPAPVAPVATPIMTSISVLYVNCWPFATRAGDDVVLFSRVAADLQRSGDYRLVDYGKGKGLFAEAVREHFAGRAWGAVVVDARTPEGADALSTLESLSSTIVKAF